MPELIRNRYRTSVLNRENRTPKASATGINDAGDIVGFDPVAGALLWHKRQQFNLNTLIPAGSGWTLVAAFAINERSDIVGQGR